MFSAYQSDVRIPLFQMMMKGRQMTKVFLRSFRVPAVAFVVRSFPADIQLTRDGEKRKGAVYHGCS